MPQRRFVAMSVQIEIVLDGDIDGRLDQRSRGVVAVDVEFAHTTAVAALVFGLDQLKDRGITEPCLNVGAHAIGPDEWHHPQSRGLGVHQLMGALVRSAGCENAGDAVAPKYFEHLVERIERIGLLVVVQVRVEKLKLSRATLESGPRRRSTRSPRQPPIFRHEPLMRAPVALCRPRQQRQSRISWLPGEGHGTLSFCFWSRAGLCWNSRAS